MQVENILFGKIIVLVLNVQIIEGPIKYLHLYFFTMLHIQVVIFISFSCYKVKVPYTYLDLISYQKIYLCHI